MLDPIMGNRDSTKPLELFESEGKRRINFRLSTPKIVLTHICFPTFCFRVIGDIDALDALDDTVEDGDDPNDEDYVEGDESNGEEENNENVEVSDTAENGKKKRPISLAEHKTKKKAKSHPVLELMSSPSTAVEKAATERAQIKSRELQARSKEMEAANLRAEAEAKLKERELAALEKKMDVETKKAEVELSMLQLQQKEQLLLARKRLLDAGVSVSEVDLMLPIK